MKYDYLKNMKEDVKEYIKENFEGVEKVDKDSLYDELFIEDSVTGNGSGSYTFNSEAAREFIYNNEDLLQEAMKEFCCSSEEIAKHIFDYEWQDVTIRCYLLGQVIEEAIEELEEEKENKNYYVTVSEILSTTVAIKAGSEEEAMEIAEKLYNQEKIVLDYINIIDHEINVLNELSDSYDYTREDIERDLENDI